MSCIGWDGKPTRPGLEMLRALSKGATSPEEVAKLAKISLFVARSGLREMHSAGFVVLEGEHYSLSEAGRKEIAEAI